MSIDDDADDDDNADEELEQLVAAVALFFTVPQLVVETNEEVAVDDNLLDELELDSGDGDVAFKLISLLLGRSGSSNISSGNMRLMSNVVSCSSTFLPTGL